MWDHGWRHGKGNSDSLEVLDGELGFDSGLLGKPLSQMVVVVLPFDAVGLHQGVLSEATNIGDDRWDLVL